ncbi:MAG: hypothetical protein ABIM64_01105 [candidate division WOR-3 bacterium]
MTKRKIVGSFMIEKKICCENGDLKKNIRSFVTVTENEYRQKISNKSFKLYLDILNFEGYKFENCFIELIYETLVAWNMNSRGAKLKKIEKFKETLLENKDKINKLKDFNLERFNFDEYKKEEGKIFTILEELFSSLDLTQTKTKLVTFSKTLHFLLPNLIVPIDRKYTLKFFELSYTNNNNKKDEFEKFKQIEKAFIEFYLSHKIIIDKIKNSKNKNSKNQNNFPVTKILDDMIIGYHKYKEKVN